MARKNRPTPTEHRALGLRLQGIRREMDEIYHDLACHYPLSDIAVVQAGNAVRHIDRVRSRLDDLVATEGAPDIAWGDSIRVYFGADVDVMYRRSDAGRKQVGLCADRWPPDFRVESIAAPLRTHDGRPVHTDGFTCRIAETVGAESERRAYIRGRILALRDAGWPDGWEDDAIDAIRAFDPSDDGPGLLTHWAPDWTEHEGGGAGDLPAWKAWANAQPRTVA